MTQLIYVHGIPIVATLKEWEQDHWQGQRDLAKRCSQCGHDVEQWDGKNVDWYTKYKCPGCGDSSYGEHVLYLAPGRRGTFDKKRNYDPYVPPRKPVKRRKAVA